MKIITILAGLLMTITGGWAIFNPKMAFIQMTWFLAIVLIVVGIFGIVGYFTNRKEFHISIWSLVAHVFTVLLGIIIIANPNFSNAIVGYLFGGWLAINGVIKIVESISIKRSNIGKWKWNLFVGILDIIIGFYAAIHPFAAALAIGLIVGMTFIMYGASLLVLGLNMEEHNR